MTRSVILVAAVVAIAGTPASSAGARASSPPAAAWSDGVPTFIGGPTGRSNLPTLPETPEVVQPSDSGSKTSPQVAGSPSPSTVNPSQDPAVLVEETTTTVPREDSADPGGQPGQVADGGTAGAVLAIDAQTGVPAGTVLTPMTGDLVIRTPGYVLQNVDLQGCLVIKATDVVVRNSRITCGTPQGLAAVQTAPTAYRFTIEDSEVDGAGRAQIGLGFSNITARRVEVRNTVDGLRASWNVVLEDSWIHAMVRSGDLHSDAVQTTGGTNIVIRGNTLDPMTPGFGDYMNAAIMIGSETSDTGLNNVLIEDNVLNGGNYTVNMRGDTTFSNVVFRNNVFGTAARYGPVQAPAGIVLEGANVLQTSGQRVRINPAR